MEKFKLKKTTDDCYTPPIVFDAIAEWVAKNYKLDRSRFVRPFFPGGDFERFDYPEGCVVVDNPPFSILAKIISFYTKHGIRFFLFAPTLTLFSKAATNFCALPIGASITYENGAVVNTSYVTNLEPQELCVRCYPELYRIVEDANKRNTKLQKKELPKYSYPVNVLTAAMAYQFSHYGIEYALDRRECVKVEALDDQRKVGKAIFGKGLLLSEKAAAEKAAAEKAAAEKAAAEKAAAEKAAAEKWTLSEREKAIIRTLGK